MPPPILAILIFIAAWLLLMGIVYTIILPRLAKGPDNDPLTGLIWLGTRIYARLVHRLQVTGRDLLPTSEADHEGLIVIANHTGAADPVLVQAPCRFLIRWIMAREFMSDSMQWFWSRYQMIPVDRDGRDSGPLRVAIRHVRKGGAIGIFPEGRIVTNPNEIWPFATGVDLIAAKTKAPILLVWIHGTPEPTGIVDVLTTRSHARVEFVERIEPDDIPEGESPSNYVRQRLADISGWQLHDEPQDPSEPQA